MATEMKYFFKLSLFLVSFLVNSAFANQQPKILIVNSDKSVARYEKISDVFKEELKKNKYTLIEFDMGGRENELENRIDLNQIIHQEEPDIIYCIGSQAYKLSKEIKNKILVFASAINWQKLNINNLTYGITSELSSEQELRMLHLFFPDVKTIGFLYSEEVDLNYIEKIKKNAQAVKLEIIAYPIRNLSEMDSALDELLPKIDLFWFLSDPLFKTKDSIAQIFKIAQQYQKTIYTYTNSYMKQGAILSIYPDIATIAKQSAILIMSLWQAELISERIQFPAGTHVTLNMCELNKSKINFDKDALSLVDDFVKCSGNE